MTEHRVCTLCAKEESPGFYTGCIIKDGYGSSDWNCDGNGNLSRHQNEAPKIDEAIAFLELASKSLWRLGDKAVAHEIDRFLSRVGQAGGQGERS